MPKALPDQLIEELGRGASKLMSQSTKVNRFLDGNYKVPANIADVDEWFMKQTNGVANRNAIADHLNHIVKEKIDLQVADKAKWIASIKLTDAQTAKVEAALTGYRKHLTDYVAAALRARAVLKPQPVVAKPEKVPAKAE